VIVVCYDSFGPHLPNLDNNSDAVCSCRVYHVTVDALKTFKVYKSNFNTIKQRTDDLVKSGQISPARFRRQFCGLRFSELGERDLHKMCEDRSIIDRS